MLSFKRRSRVVGLLAVGGAMALGLGACAPDPGPGTPTDPATQVNFDSATTSEVRITIPGEEGEEDINVTPSISGSADGSWWTGGNGAFYANLEYDDGSFQIEALGLVLTASYSAASTGVAVGNFDPATGEGGFSTSLALTVTNIDLLGDMANCSLAMELDLAGSIDAETGVLDVSQDGFFVDSAALADEDCNGLGAVIGSLLGSDDNSWDMTFEVGTP